MIVYSGEEKQGHGGVGVWIHKKNIKAIVGYDTVNSRIVVIRIKAKPKNISLIQVYAPTADKEEDEIEEFYQKLERTLKSIPKRDITLLIGDFNAKVGDMSVPPVTGNEGLGQINSRGERLIDFCMEQELTLANTWFKQHPRRLSTWTSPDGITKNQIDFIGIQRKWRTSISNC